MEQTLIDNLRRIGFIDESPDKNGWAYRKNLKGSKLQFCYWAQDDFIRLQTISDGWTTELRGVNNLDDLNDFCKLMFNKSILEL